MSEVKRAFGTQPSGLYREVVSVQRLESIAKELLGPNQVVLKENGYRWCMLLDLKTHPQPHNMQTECFWRENEIPHFQTLPRERGTLSSLPVSVPLNQLAGCLGLEMGWHNFATTYLMRVWRWR